MNQALQIGGIQIPCSQILAQLQNSPLLPKLLREITIEETIDLIAAEFQVDLKATPTELDLLSAQVTGIPSFQGMNPDQIAAITTRTIKFQKFKQAGWGHQISAYYETVEHQLQRVTYSILQVDDGALAQELFFRIESGEQSFAELAIEYSQDELASKGGLVGPVLISEVPPIVAQILSQLKPGGLSPLFQVGNYYGFIRLNQLVPPQLDETMYQLLLDRLFDIWIQTQLPPAPNSPTQPTANPHLLAPDFSIPVTAISI
jgi:parvulin-like peptidyl-prolyl isomerase